MTKPQTEPKIIQFKCTIKGIRPPIWRRVLVPSSFSLFDLHRVLEVAFCWSDDHLHGFEYGRQSFSVPHPDDWAPVLDERKYTLDSLRLKPGSKIEYTYDFGDNWEHTVEVEKVLPPESEGHYPRCIAGRRAAPPEDCGGVGGYESILDALRGLSDDEWSKELLEWHEGYDPEAFDLEDINHGLLTIRPKGRPTRRSEAKPDND